ncbi:hypothetical protein F4680DRAFT_427082 [Xylaria scruposa]|nr:hypothetical protein F4680DRAFT_427082 [Xylaria scruposa]
MAELEHVDALKLEVSGVDYLPQRSNHNRGSELLERDFLQIASLVYFHYRDPVSGLRKLDVEERWPKKVVSIHEISQQEELPTLSGKGIPGEWRSSRDWKECLQNSWTTHQRQTLNANACTVAAPFSSSLIFNTIVAPLKSASLQ